MEHLSVAELKLLLSNRQAAHPVSRLALLFSCFTGLQPADIEALQFDHIHHCGAGLVVATRSLRVPLGRMAMEVFGEVGELYASLPPLRQDGRLFGSLDRETLNDDIREWVFLAGIHRDIDLSCGRPTFCVLALQAGVSQEELASWLGLSLQTVSKYQAFVDNPHADRDIEAFDALFDPYLC